MRDKRLLINSSDYLGDLRAMQRLVDQVYSLNTGLYQHNPGSILPDHDSMDLTVRLAEMQHKIASEIGVTMSAIDSNVFNP
tara:strand:- start:487 stop:729 length:243 start_codon:yes stop_codon:yes gene_type:complete